MPISLRFHRAAGTISHERLPTPDSLADVPPLVNSQRGIASASVPWPPLRWEVRIRLALLCPVCMPVLFPSGSEVLSLGFHHTHLPNTKPPRAAVLNRWGSDSNRDDLSIAGRFESASGLHGPCWTPIHGAWDFHPTQVAFDCLTSSGETDVYPSSEQQPPSMMESGRTAVLTALPMSPFTSTCVRRRCLLGQGLNLQRGTRY